MQNRRTGLAVRAIIVVSIARSISCYNILYYSYYIIFKLYKNVKMRVI